MITMIACNSTVNLSHVIECTSTSAGATIFSPVIMFLAGVLGNILALIQLCRKRIDVQTTNFYSLVTGLVWTDLLGILLTSPSVFIAYVNGRQWYGGLSHCRFHGFVMVCFGIATPLIICAMAVERFLALKCVFFYSSKCRSSTSSSWVLLVWFVTILYGLLPLIGFGKFDIQHPGTWCYLDFHSDILSSKLYAYIYAFTILLLTVIICVCNTYVAITISKTRKLRRLDRHCSEGTLPHSSRITNERLSTTRIAKNTDIEVQMIVLLCALTLVFAICWTPLMVQIIVTMITGRTNHILDLTAVRLASLNQTLDPWLYILLGRSFCPKLCVRITDVLARLLSNFHHESAISDDMRQYQPVGAIDTQRMENNNAIVAQHSNQSEHNRHIRTELDVMTKIPDCSRSPLPDVTNTNSINKSAYLCRLQFGKSSLPEKEGGIFVKIFYPPTSIHKRTVDQLSVRTSEAKEEYSTADNKTQDSTVDELSDTCHSDNTYNIRKLDEHCSLRMTKSNT